MRWWGWHLGRKKMTKSKHHHECEFSRLRLERLRHEENWLVGTQFEIAKGLLLRRTTNREIASSSAPTTTSRTTASATTIIVTSWSLRWSSFIPAFRPTFLTRAFAQLRTLGRVRRRRMFVLLRFVRRLVRLAIFRNFLDRLLNSIVDVFVCTRLSVRTL